MRRVLGSIKMSSRSRHGRGLPLKWQGPVVEEVVQKAEDGVVIEEGCVYEKWKALVFERCGGGVGARDWSRKDVWDKQVPNPTCQATGKYHALRIKRESRMQP